MGGYTTIKLKDCSQQNINKHNKILKEFGVSKNYRYYSEADVHKEYGYYLTDDGVYPEHHFPKDKIHSYGDFTKYWNSKALGIIFVPEFGMLTFDCYFGRTSKKAMRAIGKYITEYYKDIDSVDGSFSTFMERGMTKLERTVLIESGFYSN
jgi:hypothetical protein